MKTFQALARKTAEMIGSPAAFLLAVAFVAAWALSGPYFAFSENWQLVINTSTTIITFLLVFLIQNTQTRDTKALNLKLDEIIRSIEAARNKMVNLENLADDELGSLEQEFQQLAQNSAQEQTPRRQ